MTVPPSGPTEPGAPSPQQGRRGARRWLLIFGSVAALVLIGAVTVYVATTGADEPDAAGQIVPPSPAASSVPPTARTAPPTQLFPTATASAEQEFSCRQVFQIFADMLVVEASYVETRREAADKIRHLAQQYPEQRAELETLADELDAAAQMVEDDPGAESAAVDREDAAALAFYGSGVC